MQAWPQQQHAAAVQWVVRGCQRGRDEKAYNWHETAPTSKHLDGPTLNRIAGIMTKESESDVPKVSTHWLPGVACGEAAAGAGSSHSQSTGDGERSSQACSLQAGRQHQQQGPHMRVSSCVHVLQA